MAKFFLLILSITLLLSSSLRTSLSTKFIDRKCLGLKFSKSDEIKPDFLKIRKLASMLLIAFQLIAPPLVFADGDVAIPKVPVYSKKSPDLQAFTDVSRGFKLLR